MSLPAWDEITKSEEWKGLGEPEKTTVFQSYLSDLGKMPEWKSLSSGDRFKVVRRMEVDAGKYKEEPAPGVVEGFLKPYGEELGSIATMGHVGPQGSPEPEVRFSEDGTVRYVRDVPSADPGLLQSPELALAAGGVAGAKMAAGPVGKMLAGARESLGWFTGGASELPTLAKSAGKDIVKAVEAKPLAKAVEKRQATGVLESITPEAKVSTETIPQAAQTAPKTVAPVVETAKQVEAPELGKVAEAPGLVGTGEYTAPAFKNRTFDVVKDEKGGWVIRENVSGLALPTGHLRTKKEAIDLINNNFGLTPDQIKFNIEQGTLSDASVKWNLEKAKQSGLEQLAKEQTKEAQKGMIGLDIGKKEPGPKYSFESKETENLFESARGVKPEGIWASIQEAATKVGHKFSRDFEHLANKQENAQLIFDLKRLEKQKEVVADRTVRNIGETLSGLGKKDYEVYRRKVILDDLASDVERGLYKEKELPFKFTPESLAAERGKLDAIVDTSPKLKEALDKRASMWEQVKAEYIEALSPYKPNVEDMFKDNYFRHQVLDYVTEQGIFGTGKRLRPPTKKGYTRQRTGYGGLYNTDYLEAEHNIMAQMLHDSETAKTLTKIKNGEDIASKVRATAKEQGLENWHDAIPEGYTAWQPKEGNVFHPVLSVDEKVAAQIMSGGLEDIAGLEGAFKEVLALGGKRKEWVVREEVAKTLDNIVRERPEGMAAKAEIKAMGLWKEWQLISPRRAFKYNARNLTGDAEAAFLGNASSFQKVPQAVRELGDVFFGKKPMSPDMAAWFERGGTASTLQAQELNALKQTWMFSRLHENKGLNVWEKYWKTARMTTDFRESILRYANFLDYKDQLLKGGGVPKNYGASKPEMIDSLKDMNDKAYWLSNDLLGAYDRVTVAGQTIRERWIPFWSWQEVNFKRYIQLYQNAANNGDLAIKVGKKLGATSTLTALKVGRLAIKTAAFTGALQMYNHTMFPEEEKVLPEEIKNTPHIIFGKNDKGEIEYFNRMGTLDDFISWFGLDYVPRYVDEWMTGKKTAKEALMDQGEKTIQAPMNKIVGGGVPFTKLLFETLSRRSTFPDVFKMGTVRDRWLHLARSFGLENEFKMMAEKPSKGYGRSIKEALVYSIDPGEAAYRNVYDAKTQFLKKIGRTSEGFWLTSTGDTLYNMKLAVKYDDKKAFSKYLTEYAALSAQQGRTAEQVKAGIGSALKTMHPLYGMDDRTKVSFINTLSKDEQEQLVEAVNFYNDTLLGNKRAKQGGEK
jgi:hypothetical protein